jgi:hypothetical protein
MAPATIPPQSGRLLHWSPEQTGQEYSTMTKLILAYLANPSLENAQRIRVYDRKHPMAKALLMPEDADTVTLAIHRAEHP